MMEERRGAPRWSRSDAAPRPWVGHGFDTETYQGWAKLLCTEDASRFVEPGEWGACLDFLLENGPRMVAWNLRFDAEAVLKHLPRGALERLYVLEHLNVGAYTIDLIPWKMMRVRRGKDRVEVFDVAPFFGGSLNRAAWRFLRERKLDVDAAALNTTKRAWRARRRVEAYCRRDADLTNRLARLVGDRFVKLGGSFDTPYSVAFVAADILMRETYVPALARHVEPHAEEAFSGARFECVKRGRFPDAAAYDIKSAYPAHQRDVEDAVGRWVAGRRPHRDALHAIVRVQADIDPDTYPIMAPIPVKRASKATVCPTGRFEATVLKKTFERFEDVLTPIHTLSYIPRGEIRRPYRATTDRLLAFREESDRLLKDSAKRGNNSIYGKLLNQRLEKVVREGADHDDHFTGETLVVDGEVIRFERVRKKGLLYNPLHAGLITEATRLQIWDAAMKRPDRIIMVQADGLLTTTPFLGRDVARKAGDLGFVAQGDTVSCGSGLYEIRGYARRTRGFALDRALVGGSMRGPSWWGILRGKRGETVSFTDRRPAHLSECLRGGTWTDDHGRVRDLGLKDANVFLPFTRNVNVCRDEKRVWPHIGEARRLLTESFDSAPVHLVTS